MGGLPHQSFGFAIPQRFEANTTVPAFDSGLRTTVHGQAVLSLHKTFFPECVAKGSCLTLGGLGVEPCSRSVVSTSATVRNRSQPSATVRNRSQ